MTTDAAPATAPVAEGITVPPPIYRYWRAMGGAERFGPPLAPAVATAEGVSQLFGNARIGLRYDRADLTPQAVSAETAQACLDVLNRLQAAGCDALGLGRKAIWSAWSMSDWRDSDFPARLQNLRWTVEVRSEPAA